MTNLANAKTALSQLKEGEVYLLDNNPTKKVIILTISGSVLEPSSTNINVWWIGSAYKSVIPGWEAERFIKHDPSTEPSADAIESIGNMADSLIDTNDEEYGYELHFWLDVLKAHLKEEKQ